jgi:hypothetical protein
MCFINRFLAIRKLIRDGPDAKEATSWIMNEESIISLQQTRRENGLTIIKLIPSYPKRSVHGQTSESFCLDIFSYYFFLCILVPWLILSGLYGFLYPYISIMTTDFENVNQLQLILTFSMAFLALCILILAPRAFFWKRFDFLK